MNATRLAEALTAIRPELTRYVTRLCGGPDAAEDVVQSTYVRAHDALDRAPARPEEMRRWLFRIATNLALDELRRRVRIRRRGVIELRALAEANPAFMRRSAALVATPELTHVVREHIDVCFSCVARNLPPRQAAALVLREVHGFSVVEAASILGARATQVKNWVQTARRTMEARYAETCALVAKRGVCHQCIELSGFFGARGPAEYGIAAGSLDERLRAIRPLNSRAVGEWHRALLVLDESSA